MPFGNPMGYLMGGMGGNMGGNGNPFMQNMQRQLGGLMNRGGGTAPTMNAGGVGSLRPEGLGMIGQGGVNPGMIQGGMQRLGGGFPMGEMQKGGGALASLMQQAPMQQNQNQMHPGNRRAREARGY